MPAPQAHHRSAPRTMMVHRASDIQFTAIEFTRRSALSERRNPRGNSLARALLGYSVVYKHTGSVLCLKI